jgi:hypothetical protein
MPEDPPSARELDEYRGEADRFLAELLQEEYLQLSGQKERLELEPIYERYAHLSTLESCRQLGELAAAAAKRSPKELWRFGCEGYIGQATRAKDERIAELEATLEAEVDGERLPFRLLRPAIANEPDRDRRERLNRARMELTDELNPHHLEALELTRQAAQELVGGSYLDLYSSFGVELEPLASQCDRFLADTEELYVAAFDRLLRARVGVPLEEAHSFDVARLMRAQDWDDAFPADRMLPALDATLTELGIDLRAQRNVHLDVERRPTKDSRAFCAPIEVPGRIVLCLQPMGGFDDWRALFHEAGHTEHFAHTSSQLAFVPRRLGDNAVTEGYAFLLEGLVTDRAWLARLLDFGPPDEFAREWSSIRLYYVRRYCGKLRYELELHAGAAPEDVSGRYVEWMREATKVEFPETDFLADVDAGFYVTSYLRAWALEAQLADFLRHEFGHAWFASRNAGSLLRELWNEGQGLDADRLLDEVTGGTLELAAVADELRSAV